MKKIIIIGIFLFLSSIAYAAMWNPVKAPDGNFLRAPNKDYVLAPGSTRANLLLLEDE